MTAIPPSDPPPRSPAPGVSPADSPPESAPPARGLPAREVPARSAAPDPAPDPAHNPGPGHRAPPATAPRMEDHLAGRAAPAPGEAADEVVAFSVSGQDFCIDIMTVREIRGWTETTILPHAQSFVKGVINLRGTVVPVIDLSDRLGLGPVSPGARHVIIITQIGPRIVGLLAEMVTDILALPRSAIQPVPDVAAEAARAFISGVASVEGRMLRRIDLARILPQPEGRAA